MVPAHIKSGNRVIEHTLNIHYARSFGFKKNILILVLLPFKVI